MKASIIRQITRLLPLPSGVVMQALNRYDGLIRYPKTPVVIDLSNRSNVMEITNFHEAQQRRIYFLERYELREIRLCEQVLKPGDIFVDIGANIGWFTLFASRLVGESGRVIAFEPSSQIYPQLQRTVELNHLLNVKLEKIALSDEKGTAILSGYAEDNWGISSIVLDESSLDPSKTERVKTWRFSDYCQEAGLEFIKMVKIDVEGAELKVLEGMDELLQKKAVEQLIIEVRKEGFGQGKSAEDVIAYLQRYGYSIFKIEMLGIKPLKSNEELPFQGAYCNILAKGT